MKKIKNVFLDEHFECECGNNSFKDGFFPCDKKGNIVEPDFNWQGYYICQSCNQVFLNIKQLF